MHNNDDDDDAGSLVDFIVEDEEDDASSAGSEEDDEVDLSVGRNVDVTWKTSTRQHCRWQASTSVPKRYEEESFKRKSTRR